MIKHGHVSVTALVTGTILSGLALSACQRSATNTAAVDPNATAPPYPAVATPTVRYIERPRRHEDEDERAYAARLASDAAYQARLQQAAADRARYGQQRGAPYSYGPPPFQPPPPQGGAAYRAGLNAGEAQGFNQGRDQEARLDGYQAQAAQQGAAQARVDQARRQLADAYRQAAETPDPARQEQLIDRAKGRLAAAMAAMGR